MISRAKSNSGGGELKHPDIQAWKFEYFIMIYEETRRVDASTRRVGSRLDDLFNEGTRRVGYLDSPSQCC